MRQIDKYCFFQMCFSTEDEDIFYFLVIFLNNLANDSLNDMQVCYDTQSYVSLMCVHQSVSRPVVYTGCLWNSGEKNQKGPTCVQEGGVRKSWYVNSEERTACVVCWTDLRGHLIARIDVGIEHMDKPRIPLHFFMFKMYISILNFMLWQQSAHGLVKAQELLGYG